MQKGEEASYWRGCSLCLQFFNSFLVLLQMYLLHINLKYCHLVAKFPLKTNKQFKKHQLLHTGMEEARRLQAGMERSRKLQAAECTCIAQPQDVRSGSRTQKTKGVRQLQAWTEGALRFQAKTEGAPGSGSLARLQTGHLLTC